MTAATGRSPRDRWAPRPQRPRPRCRRRSTPTRLAGVGSAATLGRFGEEVARRHLEADGASVLARNWRCRAGEIDLIVRDGGDLVLCEVKTRRSTRFGTPAEAVTPGKAAPLRRLAGIYLAQRRGGYLAVRFDVISVTLGPTGPPRVEHLRAVL